MEFTIVLTEDQVNTIKDSLRTDYQKAKEFGALPIGLDLQNEIEDAYAAIARQTKKEKGND